MVQKKRLSTNTDAAIPALVIDGSRLKLVPEAARALLTLNFTSHDRIKMHELAIKNQQGVLSAAEERELDSYIRIGRFLDLLSAKAALERMGK